MATIESGPWTLISTAYVTSFINRNLMEIDRVTLVTLQPGRFPARSHVISQGSM